MNNFLFHEIMTKDSNIFESWDYIEIGLYLETLDRLPDLGISMVELNSSIDGNTLSFNDRLNSRKRGYDIIDLS